MSRENPTIVSGYAFAKSVIDHYPDCAGDVLLKAAEGCERDWLELKASFYVRPDDSDFANKRLLGKNHRGVTDGEWLNELNLGRIAQTILAMHNSRGGVILVGVAPGREHEAIPLDENDPYGVMSSKSRDLGDYVEDAVSRLVKVRRFTGGSDYGTPTDLRKLFDWKLVLFRGHQVCALIVKTCPFSHVESVTRLNDGHAVVFCRALKSSGKNETLETSSAKDLDSFNSMRREILVDPTLSDLISNTHGPAYCSSEILARYLEGWARAVPGGGRQNPLEGASDFRAPRVTWSEAWSQLWTFSLSGRASRSEFWADIGFYLLFLFGCSFLTRVFWNFWFCPSFQILPHLAGVCLAAPLVRRCHDLGLSGWLVAFLPFFYYVDVLLPSLKTIQFASLGVLELSLFLLGAIPGRRVPTRYDAVYKGVRLNWFVLAVLIAGFACFAFMSRNVVETRVMSDEMVDLGIPSKPASKMDKMVFEMIKANGCIFQDRYEREVSPAYRAGSSDALVKHLHLLVDERDAFRKVRALYLTGDGRMTASVNTFGIPSEGLSKGIDAIIAKHDAIVELILLSSKKAGARPDRSTAARLKKLLDELDVLMDRLFAYGERLGLDLD